MAALTVDFRKPNGLTPADDTTESPKSPLNVETSQWTSSSVDSVPLHCSSRIWDIDFQIKCKLYCHLKKGLCSNPRSVSVIVSLGKTLAECMAASLLSVCPRTAVTSM
ncbi:hypothetical protein ILYODFUR_018653 [Ilyodon furcidens]|uniref:Uncharacterized protein n=1 Tax=Ilyodon furcidens TaxID=33524 RepID=A0ABV0SMD4_9TELE